MARINVFEGSRRIALLIRILWILAVVGVVWQTRPYVSMNFATSGPNQPFVRTIQKCDIGTDGVEFIDRDIEEGNRVSIELCFKAQLAESGARVIPYKVEADTGRWWGNERYSSEVSTYTEARAREFQLQPVDQEAAGKEWTQQRWQTVGKGFLFAIGGWGVLWLLQAVVGWIVRGYLGIPWGQDSRIGVPPKDEQP